MKKIIAFIMAMLMLMPYPVTINASGEYSKSFTDVSKSNEYYDAIMYLAEKGIINGYSDNTFKPNNAISRAEAATIIVRSTDISADNAPSSVYSDVADNFWARPYIMAATEAGIISGVGNNNFSPDSAVTHKQIIKMIVCMMSWDDDVDKHGGWPKGYLYIAKGKSIINDSIYWELYYDRKDTSATRGEVAQYIYNALMNEKRMNVEVAGRKYFVGMNASELNSPDEKLLSFEGYTMYVYGTKTYKDFVILGVRDDKVMSIISAGDGFVYNGLKAGDTTDDKSLTGLRFDNSDNGRIYAIYLKEKVYNDPLINEETMYGESRIHFHCTNAFRVLHGKSILKWSDDAATSARLHSEDMAENDYFSHESLDGRRASDRINAQGIDWSSYGENISAGYNSGFASYDGLVNSPGHRSNILKDRYTHLGIGIGYNPDSRYTLYYTQNFFS